MIDHTHINDVSWGYRFGDLVNALIDCGCRMQSVRYVPGQPNVIKFYLRPGIRFVLRYDVDDCPHPGQVNIKRIAVVIPIGKLTIDDDLNHPVKDTAAMIFGWAKTGKCDSIQP